MMNPIEHAIVAARRRLLLQNGLTILGWLLLFCCWFAVVLVLANRLLAVATPLWLPAAAVTVAVLVAPWIAWWRRPSRRDVAVLTDQRLGLKDQLGSALFASSKIDDPMARRVVRDAQETAIKLPLASAFPVHLSQAWRYLFPSVAVLMAMVLFVPRMDLAGLAHARSRENDQLVRVAQIKQQLLAVQQAVSAIEHVKVGEAGLDPAGAEHEDDFLSQVSQRDLTDPEINRQAAVNLSRLQDQLTEQTQQPQQLLDMVQNILSRLDPTGTGPAAPFTEALGRGDFPATQEAVADLIQSIQSMNESQRKVLRQQLEELAQQLHQSSLELAQKEDDTQKQIQKLLEEVPLPQEAIDQGPPNDPASSEPADDLQRNGGDIHRPSVQQIVQQLQQQQRRSEQSKQFCQELSDRLDEAGQAVGEQSKQVPDRDEKVRRSFERLGDKLSRMSQIHRQLRQTRRAQRHAEQAMEGLAQSQKDSPGLAAGKDPLVPESGIGSYQVHPSRVVEGRQTEASASWLTGDANIKGQPDVVFDQAITRARSQAEQAVTEDRVPSRYHQTIRDYFNRLPQTNDSAAVSPPP